MPLSFLAGLVTAGFLVIALFFFRYWRRTGDGLLAWFGAAFLVLGGNQALAELIELGRDEQGWVWVPARGVRAHHRRHRAEEHEFARLNLRALVPVMLRRCRSGCR
jgi:hypothetical protein